jgi:DNA-binding transcriptional LysR family regulator
MRIIDLESLHIFRAVVQEGGVVRAATRLHRVPSNVSTRLRQLEAYLGVTLFRREGRTLCLSAEGHILLDYAQRLLQLADEAEHQLRDAPAQGCLRLGSLESTAASRLPQCLSRFHAQHPRVAVELATGTSAALIRRVMRFELEAAFVSEPFSAPELQSHAVFNEQLVLITARGVEAIVDARMLAAGTMIAFAQGCSYRQCLLDWLADAAVRPERVLEFASYQAIIACVAAGSGYALVPQSVLALCASTDDILQHPLPPAIAQRRTHLVWRGQASRALLGLIALLPAA